eukprot:108318_1
MRDSTAFDSKNKRNICIHSDREFYFRFILIQFIVQFQRIFIPNCCQMHHISSICLDDFKTNIIYHHYYDILDGGQPSSQLIGFSAKMKRLNSKNSTAFSRPDESNFL